MVIALPVFYLVTFFFAVLAVWIQGALSRRSGNRCFRISRNKQIIRTRPPQGRTGSDYMGLVPLTGLEPVRILLRGILSPLCLPIPPQRHFPYKKYCNMIQYFPQEVKSYPRFFLSSVHKKRIRFPFFSKRFLESVFQPLQNCSSAFPKKCGTKAG